MKPSYSVTPQEVSSIWRLLLNTGERDPDKLFSVERIEKAVNDLVGLGEIRKEVASEAKAVAVLGGEVATGQSIGTEFTADFPEQIDERYFEGSESELKQARTGQRGIEPTRRRLKPVEDIDAGMLKILRKSFSTSHGRRFFREVRNEYRRGRGQDPVGLKTVRAELRKRKDRETESPIVPAARKAARRAAGSEERSMGAQAGPSRTTDVHRRNLGRLTSADLPEGIEFDPAKDAERAIRRLRRAGGKPNTVPFEGGKAKSQADPPSEERIAADRATRIRLQEVRMLNRILKSGTNPNTGERLTSSERAAIKENLRKPSGSLAKSIDVVGKKAKSIAGGVGRLLARYTGFDPTVRKQAGDVGAAEQKPLMLRALSKTLAAINPQTRAEVSKVAKRKRAMELLKVKLGTRKPKRGDNPTKPFSSLDDVVRPTLTESMRESFDTDRRNAFYDARREEAIALLKRRKAGLSPRILEQPTTLPPGRRATQREGKIEFQPAETEAGRRARAAEDAASLEALSKRVIRDRNQDEAMLRGAESVRKFRLRKRKDRGGTYSSPPLPPEFTDVPPEVLERAATRAKSGKGPKLLRGAEARKALAALTAMGKRKKK